jgi:excisionase family DNA binding protein
MDSMNSSRPGPNLAALLGVREVAALLGCSARHVYRMADAGRMPRPLKLGQLVRWRRGELARMDRLTAARPFAPIEEPRNE